MIGHPSERELLGFVGGGTSDAHRQRLARHLAGCQRCRDVVQGHRRVRQALTAGESPAPPPLLFDRVLATRASGEGVILPVEVEPRPRREWRVPFSLRRVALGVVAASLLLALGVVLREVVPPLPMAALGERTGAAFDRLIEGLGNPRPLGPLIRRPDAPPAMVHPKRLREFTATYEARHFSDGRLIAADSFTRIEVRRTGDRWQVASTTSGVEGYRDRNDTPRFETTLRCDTAELSGSDLSLRKSSGVYTRWTRNSRARTGWMREVLGDSAILATMVSVVTPDSLGRGAKTDTTIYRIAKPLDAPGVDRGLGEVAIFTTVELGRWWAGSLGRYFLYKSRRTRSEAEPYITSYRVTGSARVVLPIGQIDTWEVEQWSDGYVYPERRNYRKSDGLLAALLPTDEPRYTELRLLSVTYP